MNFGFLETYILMLCKIWRRRHYLNSSFLKLICLCCTSSTDTNNLLVEIWSILEIQFQQPHEMPLPLFYCLASRIIIMHSLFRDQPFTYFSRWALCHFKTYKTHLLFLHDSQGGRIVIGSGCASLLSEKVLYFQLFSFCPF